MGKLMLFLGLLAFLFLLDPDGAMRQLDRGLRSAGWHASPPSARVESDLSRTRPAVP